MTLWTPLTLAECKWIADELGMELYEAHDDGEMQRGPNKGLRRLRFTLRPQKNDAGEKVRLVRLTFEGKPRRVWAVSWAGHYNFMERVFSHAPRTKIKTAIETYTGRADFYEYADATGHKNIGSIMAPLAYADADSNLLMGE